MALQLIGQPVNQRMRIRSDDGALALVEADAMKLGSQVLRSTLS